MGYFNYHAKAKNKIKQGQLLYYKIVDKHNSISPAMVLYFNDNTIMPIREYRWSEYYQLFAEFDVSEFD